MALLSFLLIEIKSMNCGIIVEEMLQNYKMNKNCDYLSWEDYFLSVAFLSGMRSKDPSSQVGACIVNKDNIIVSIGYNGMPRGCSDDELPWAKEAENKLDTKYMYVCHAEMNAVVNKNSADLAGCRIYVVLFPCNECAKIVIQSRIKEVIFYSDKHSHKPETIASKKMLDMAGIKYRNFSPQCTKIGINFRFLDSTDDNITYDFQQIQISENTNKKRVGYLAWEEYFMALAFLSSKRSKNTRIQLGACIVNAENKIVGIGYNGLPRGCDDSKLPRIDQEDEERINMLVCHAEMNAVLNKNCAKISGCKMYVLQFPCNECAKFIIQEEIQELIYFSDAQIDSPESLASKTLFDMAGIKYRRYEGKLEKLMINFESIDWNKTTQLPPTPTKIYEN